MAILLAKSDVTRILSQIERSDSKAAEQLLPLVYNELRKLAAANLAQEKPGQTLQATALKRRRSRFVASQLRAANLRAVSGNAWSHPRELSAIRHWGFQAGSVSLLS